MKHPSHLLVSLIAVAPFFSYGQSPCDSLVIISLEYAPFTDTALQVIVEDHGGMNFTGPYFSLIGADGDTIAREQPYFFGLGIVPSAHRLDLLTGVSLPISPFEGTLVLRYQTIDGEFFCNYPITVDPCPPDDCIDLMVTVHNASGGIMDTTSFQWNITNDQEEVVGSGILEVDGPEQQGIGTSLCIAPGAYELHLEQNGSNGESFKAGFTQGHYQLRGPYEEFNAGGSIQIPFNYYTPCIASGMSIAETPASGLQLISSDRSLTITDPDGEHLGHLVIIDSSGRNVRSVISSGSAVTIDLAGFAPGMYLVDPISRGGAAQRFLIK